MEFKVSERKRKAAEKKTDSCVGLAAGKAVCTPELASEGEGVKIYYEHQYQRMAEIEDQAFKMSGGIFLLTAAVFGFLSSTSRSTSSSVFSWRLVVSIMCLANMLAVVYLWRVHAAICVHQHRAKAVLKQAWPALWKLDQQYQLPFAGKIQIRPMIHMMVHILLAGIGIWALYAALFHST